MYTVEGWLMKESHDVFRAWQDRFFVLNAQERKLSYFQEAQKLNCKGTYEFTSNSTCTMSNSSTQPNVFILTGKSAHGDTKAELYLSASTNELRQKWIEVINKAINVIAILR
jgi:hypothetical protein